MTAREKHKAKLQDAREEFHRLRGDTPHRRDLLRSIRRMERELKEYDYYMRRCGNAEHKADQAG